MLFLRSSTKRRSTLNGEPAENEGSGKCRKRERGFDKDHAPSLGNAGSWLGR